MNLTTRRFASAVLAASVAVLGTALASQYWGGLFPCELCLLQRWPWRVAIVLSLAALLLGERAPLRLVAPAMALVFLLSAGFAAYHIGVEQHWLAGPSSCTAGPDNAASSIEDLRRQLTGRQPVLCDEVQWSLFGVSLAGWNLVVSAIALIACVEVARRGRFAA